MNCFGMLLPIRLPMPPAVIIAIFIWLVMLMDKNVFSYKCLQFGRNTCCEIASHYN